MAEDGMESGMEIAYKVKTKTCPLCGKDGTVELTPDQVPRYVAWKTGSVPYIQEALPDLSNADREQIISGAHSACFDALFPPEDEECDCGTVTTKHESTCPCHVGGTW